MEGTSVTPVPPEPTDDQPTLVGRLKKAGRTTLPFAVSGAVVLGYVFVPYVEQSLNWLTAMGLIGLSWLWANGYAMPALWGVLLYLVNAIAGFRVRTWFYNMGRVRDEAKSKNLGRGFLHSTVSVNDFIAAALVGVGYTFYTIVATPTEVGVASPTLWDVLTGWRAHLELLEVSGGVLLGIWAAPWLGRLLLGFRYIATLGRRVHYEEWRVLVWTLRQIATIYSRLYEWGHLDAKLTEEEEAANRQALGIARVTIYPFAFAYNTLRGVGWFLFGRRETWSGSLFKVLTWIIILVVLPWTRELWAPVLVKVVNFGLYLPIMSMAIATLWGVYRLFRWVGNLTRQSWIGEALGVTAVALLAIFMAKLADEVNYYTHLYAQHESLAIVPVNGATLPVMVEPRLYPLAVMRDGMNAKLEAGVTTASNPAYVSVGDKQMWTAMIDRLHLMERWAKPATDLFALPATSTSVTFGRDEGQRQSVCFDAHPQGVAGRNVYTAAHRRLPLSRLATHEPHEMRLMQDDAGRWVQVVSFGRFAGFPRQKKFGGVVVIPQCNQYQQVWLQGTWLGSLWPAGAEAIDDAIPSMVYRELFGLGTYVSPEEIAAGKFSFLTGNNLIAEATARRIAESFRFHRDVWAPFSTSRSGDVRIPDSVTDRNHMPHFGRWVGLSDRSEPAMYAHIALQPWGEGDTLAYDLWIPADGATDADGRPIVYMLDATAEGMDTMDGPTAVAAKVRNALPEAVWGRFEIAEVTAYKRELGGSVRSLYLARLVSKSNRDSLVFTSDLRMYVYDPEFAQVHQLTDPDAGEVAWDAEILAAFGKKWGVTLK